MDGRIVIKVKLKNSYNGLDIQICAAFSKTMLGEKKWISLT